MRAKRRSQRPTTPATADDWGADDSGADDSSPIDLGATARQIGLFETSIGWQHGFIDILVALGAALMLLPLGAFLRRIGRDRSSRRP